jgi:ABC-type nitrate/sulfonate/bicarbonate transport system permease component
MSTPAPATNPPVRGAGVNAPGVAQFERQARQRRRILRGVDSGIAVLSVLAFLVLWEWVTASGHIKPLFISSPTRIAAATARIVGSGEIWPHLRVSLSEFGLGFGLAIVLGVPVGILVGWYRWAFAASNPFISGINATPREALMPLIVIWLGIAIWSKVALVFLGAVFPILFNMMTAMHTLDDSLLRVARSFGAKDRQIFRTIALPSSIPFLISGLRIGAGRGLVGIVLGELYAANAGIGYLIAIYGSTFQTDKLFVAVLFITTMGISLDLVLRRLERRFEAWRPAHR